MRRGCNGLPDEKGEVPVPFFFRETYLPISREDLTNIIAGGYSSFALH